MNGNAITERISGKVKSKLVVGFFQKIYMHEYPTMEIMQPIANSVSSL